MQTRNNTDTDNITTNAGVADRLPDLDEETVQEMGDPEHRQWAHGFIAYHYDGQSHFFDQSGVTIQRVTEEVVRCTAIVDHDWCYASLAWMRASFEAAGIEVQVDPYTVVTPYIPKDDDGHEPQDILGMEVA